MRNNGKGKENNFVFLYYLRTFPVSEIEFCFLFTFLRSFSLSLHSPAEGQDRITERVELN